MRGQIAVIFVVAMLCCRASRAQTIASLEQDIENAESEIRRTNTLLTENRGKQSVNSSQLSMVQSTIRNRRKIISSLDKQMKIIKGDISSNNSKLEELGGDLIALKKEYTKALVAGYKNYRLSNYVLFLFSARDFNDLAIRLYYLRVHSQQREEKAKRILEFSTDINVKVSELVTKKSELDKVVKEKSNEMAQLSKEEKEYNSMLTKLKSEAGNMTKSIQTKQRLIERLNSEIRRIIEEEARKMNSESSASTTLAAERVVLTGNFDQNKGSLPMPVSGGVIIEPFGEHSHPSQPGLKVNNKGVNIASVVGSPVTSVFKGKVSKILFFHGMNNCIMVRHGSYISVYSNLATVNVEVNQEIDTSQQIGTVASDGGSGSGSLHFELWKETTVIDPELWLIKEK